MQTLTLKWMYNQGEVQMKGSLHRDTNIKKYYILTQPTRLSDITLDELEDDDNYAWRDKARKLQTRRWKRLKHRLA